MRKDILSLFAVALFVSVSVASAGVKNCNNTLVTQGVCGNTTQTAGACSAGQIGQQVPNPETKPQAASRYLRELVREAVRGDKLNDIVTAGAASIPPAEVTD